MKTNYFSIFICILFTASCNNGPKVIPADTPQNNAINKSGSTGIFTSDNSSATSSTMNNANGNSKNGMMAGMHQVVVNEILPTPKYIYLNVTEGDESFWIATAKQEVEVGQKIFYKGGLLKTNFESKEYNRVFDKVYLVSKIVTAGHGVQGINKNSSTISSDKKTKSNDETKSDKTNAPRNITKNGSIKISEIIANPKNYEGKIIQVSGECEKVNYNIMGKNWIHLKDGSKDEYDFVITSEVQIPEGHVVTMKGKVYLDKDFGAGYRYDIIIEEGEIVQ